MHHKKTGKDVLTSFIIPNIKLAFEKENVLPIRQLNPSRPVHFRKLH